MSMENITAVEALDCLIAAGTAIKQQWAREGSKTDGSWSPFLLINDWEGWRDITKEKVSKLQARIEALEAERDKAVELLKRWRESSSMIRERKIVISEFIVLHAETFDLLEQLASIELVKPLD